MMERQREIGPNEKSSVERDLLHSTNYGTLGRRTSYGALPMLVATTGRYSDSSMKYVLTVRFINLVLLASVLYCLMVNKIDIKEKHVNLTNGKESIVKKEINMELIWEMDSLIPESRHFIYGQYFIIILTILVTINMVAMFVSACLSRRYWKVWNFVAALLSVIVLLLSFCCQVYLALCPWTDVGNHGKSYKLILNSSNNVIEGKIELLDCSVANWTIAGLLGILSMAAFVADGLHGCFADTLMTSRV